MALAIGSQLAGYHIVAPLGRGGMGEVYRATDPRLGRDVALKILPQQHLASPEQKERFIREARAASALNHPNIITIYEIGSDRGIDFIAMELVRGRTLKAVVSDERTTFADLMSYALQINPNGNGGKVTGVWQKDGVSFNGTPNLVQNDKLQVAVALSGGGNPPAALSGYMIIGPECQVAASQQDASPFLNGNKQICVQPALNVTQLNGFYTFGPGFTMGSPGNALRRFELTFVVVDPATLNQWEEDPEFDTGT